MSNLEISESIARYSMDMAAVRVSSAVQASMLKNVMELERATMAQLLQSMGVGGALDVQA
ncbi:MAG: putative motility protein [Fretibacterium sp.]|uniref:putative motility protein n=1 Tax=Fretibacterium sp. OH1220_COT-178 TaxID=2491047 RepID=UPI000F5DD3BC|nr:putative motility protein [Fretibacterium sp. OH1220_COT-178]MDO4786853.1 putative motility protein [Fretibacterium sp.]RRD65602.1 putative motility protein [Fretibacterium sp. OH1220_COT-178]